MNGVLALNGDYRVLRVLPLTRAVTLVLLDKAEVLEETDAPFRSAPVRTAHGQLVHAPVSMKAPSVIKLKYVVKIPMRTKLPVTRRNVLARDNSHCAYSGRPNAHKEGCLKTASTVDHVTPRSRGGRHAWENVVASCLPCNARKDDHTLAEMKWTLPFKPWAPERALWLGIATQDTAPAWSQYLPAM